MYTKQRLAKFFGILNSENGEILTFISLQVLIIISNINGAISMGHGEFNDFTLFLIGAFIGIFVVMYVSKKNFVNSTFLKTIGDSSFTIMALHFPLKKIVVFLISKACSIQMSDIYASAFYSIIATMDTILILYYLIKFKNRFIKLKFLR